MVSIWLVHRDPLCEGLKCAHFIRVMLWASFDQVISTIQGFPAKQRIKRQKSNISVLFHRSRSSYINFACEYISRPGSTNEPDATIQGLEDIGRTAKAHPDGHWAHTHARRPWLYGKAPARMADIWSGCNDRPVVQSFGWNAAGGCCCSSLWIRQAIYTACGNASIGWNPCNWRMRHLLPGLVPEIFRMRSWSSDRGLKITKKYAVFVRYFTKISW